MGRPLTHQFSDSINVFRDAEYKTKKGQIAIEFILDILLTAYNALITYNRCGVDNAGVNLDNIIARRMQETQSDFRTAVRPLTKPEISEFEYIYRQLIESFDGHTIVEKMEPVLAFYLRVLSRSF